MHVEQHLASVKNRTKIAEKISIFFLISSKKVEIFDFEFGNCPSPD